MKKDSLKAGNSVVSKTICICTLLWAWFFVDIESWGKSEQWSKQKQKYSMNRDVRIQQECNVIFYLFIILLNLFSMRLTNIIHSFPKT